MQKTFTFLHFPVIHRHMLNRTMHQRLGGSWVFHFVPLCLCAYLSSHPYFSFVGFDSSTSTSNGWRVNGVGLPAVSSTFCTR